MKNSLLVMGAVALLSTAVIAGPNSSGAYVGAGFGTTGYEDDDFVKKELLRFDLDKTDSGYKIYGGYQFNNIVGVEAGYTDYGTFTATQDYSQSSTSFSVGANVGYSFLDGQLRPFGVVGLGYVTLDYENIPAVSIDDGAGAFHYGLGVQYEPDFLIGFGLRLAYEADLYAITVTRLLAEDETYIQALGLLYLGVQYKF
ncbi:MAG: porin family protein [Sulfurimonadaceae bacterium]